MTALAPTAPARQPTLPRPTTTATTPGEQWWCEVAGSAAGVPAQLAGRFRDVPSAQLLVMCGTDRSLRDPRLVDRLRRARRHGTRILVVSPLGHVGSAGADGVADLQLAVHPDSGNTLFGAIEALLRGGDVDWTFTVAITGLTRDQVEQAAAMFAASQRTVICRALAAALLG